MIVLYEHPLSPYAQKVKIALGEKGLAFEARMPDFFGADERFTAANPRQEVPALIDEDTAVFDSTVILEYIEDRWPTPPLLPATPAARARARMLEDLCDTYYEAIVWAIFEITIFQRASGSHAERLLARATEQIAGANAYLERQLGLDPWFGGATFGWADLSIVPVLNAASLTGNTPAPGSRLAAWLDHARARPTVAAVLRAAEESMPGFRMVNQFIESGQFKREYRDHRLEWMVRTGAIDVVMSGLEKQNIRFAHELT